MQRFFFSFNTDMLEVTESLLTRKEDNAVLLGGYFDKTGSTHRLKEGRYDYYDTTCYTFADQAVVFHYTLAR